MVLRHVCMWGNKGWQHIELETFKKIHPVGDVAAKSKLLLCDLCDQYVTFVNTSQYQYFKHQAGEADKSCQDRSSSEIKRFDMISFRTLTLPLKLRLGNGMASFELGLLPLPNTVLQKCEGARFRISAGKDMFTYSFLERLHEGEVTFLSVGDKPSETYRISSNALCWTDIEKFWPEKTVGIYKKGTFFDGKTGRRILSHASVRIDYPYFLLLHGKGLILHKSKEISMELQTNLPDDWRVYSVRATEFTEYAAKFFLKYHVRLQTEKTQIMPLWPPCTTCADIMHTPDRTIAFAMLGNSDLEVKSYPAQKINLYSNSSIEYKLFDFNFNRRQQLIFIGINQMIQYQYLWKDPLTKVKQNPPRVSVKDETEDELSQNVYSILPTNGRLFIQPEFDGQAVLLINDFVCLRTELKAGKTTTLVVHLGDKLCIRQGCDCVRTIVFQEESASAPSKGKSDHRLAARLMASGPAVFVPYSLLGAAAAKLPNFPETRLVLYRFVKQGFMPQKAYLLLKKYLSTI